jgi:hypothetical protein
MLISSISFYSQICNQYYRLAIIQNVAIGVAVEKILCNRFKSKRSLIILHWPDFQVRTALSLQHQFFNYE